MTDREFVKLHGRVALRLEQLVVVSLFMVGHHKHVILEPSGPEAAQPVDLWALARRTEHPSWSAHGSGDLGAFIVRLGPKREARIQRHRAMEEPTWRLMAEAGLGVCRRCRHPKLGRLGEVHTCKGGQPLILTRGWCLLGVELFRQVPA